MTVQRRDFVQVAMAFAAVGAGLAVAPETSKGAVADQAIPKLPDGWASKFGDTNGIKMHYVIAGSGPPVFLLHGWPQTWFAWRETMERLARRFTVIAPDLRGTGLSDRPATGYDKRTIAADIRGLIVSVAGGRSHVVGHDMGGKASYVLAHIAPECIDKLVLVDCLIPGTEVTDALQGGAWHYGFHMAANIPEMLTQGREREYISSQIRAWSFRKNAVGEDKISEFARHYASPGGMTAGFNYYRALREDAATVASFGDRVLDLPVLAIGGRYSAGSKLADALRARTRDLHSIVADNSGHFVAEEVPDFFCTEVEKFLTG
jgi:pimeloyl-ACP methyl ester carboxylesterase